MNCDQQFVQALSQEGIRHYAVIADPGRLSREGLDRTLCDGVGDMPWLAAHQELRLQPSSLFPGLARVVVVCLAYEPEPQPSNPEALCRARYAAGADYHNLLRKKLARVGAALRNAQGASYPSRACVDSAPVNERSLALLANLGWLGRNALILHPKRGSYHVLGVLFTQAPLSLRSGGVAHDHCGNCTRCESACPTAALVDRRVISTRCISYLTIEHQGVIPRALAQRFHGWWFGCDICQEVCPWNRFAPEAEDGRLRGREDEAALLRLGAQDFDQYFAARPVRRLGWERFQRNLLVALWSLGRHHDLEPLLRQAPALVLAQAVELGLLPAQAQTAASPP